MDNKAQHKAHRTAFFALLMIALIIIIKKGYLNFLKDLINISSFDIFINPLIIIFTTIIIAKLVSTSLQKYFERATKKLKVDKTKYSLFSKITTAMIYIIGFGVAGSMIPALRSISVSLFAGAGVLAIIIGFATQKTIGNLFSGVIIATYQPYRIGDRIKLGEELGVVEDINLRHTIIKTWDNRRIIVPNSKMDEEIINNYTIDDPKMLGYFDIGISYDSDIDLARKIMIEEAIAHPDFLDNRTEEEMLAKNDPVTVRVVEAGDFSINMRLYYWAKDQTTNFKIKCDLIESIKKRFDKEGVEIPFPYRTIVQKKDLPKNKVLKKEQKEKEVKKINKK